MVSGRNTLDSLPAQYFVWKQILYMLIPMVHIRLMLRVTHAEGELEKAHLQGGLLGISFLVVMKASNMYRSPPL